VCQPQTQDSEGVAGEAAQEQAVTELQRDFRRRMSMIYATLCSGNMQENQRAPYLRQFLLRLNFNGFVEAVALSDALNTASA
jgi:gamma-tubulin complex component 4